MRRTAFSHSAAQPPGPHLEPFPVSAHQQPCFPHMPLPKCESKSQSQQSPTRIWQKRHQLPRRPRRRPSLRPSGQSSLVASHSTTHRSASEPHPSDPSALSDSVPSALYLVAATYQLSRGLLRCAANRRPKIPSLISFLPTPLVSGPFLSMSCPQFRPPHTCTYACTMVPWTMSIGHSLGFMMKAHPLPPARPIATQPPARVPPSLLTGRACCAPLLAA